MKRFAAVASALLMLLEGLPAFAQTDPQQKQPGFSATIDVRVINIDVVVTDKKGNPIKGLKKGDFEVLENGTPQKITNFSEISVPAQPPTKKPVEPEVKAAPAVPVQVPENQKRKIIIFVDNLSLNPFNRNRVFDSMEKFVKTAMRPGDEAMVATWNRSMKVRVPFTTDSEQITQMLEGIKGESAFGVHNLSDQKQTQDQIRDAQSYDQAVAAARQYAQSVEHDLRQTVSAVNGLMTTLAGVEGKKIMVMTSEGFPMQPGKDMFYFIDDIQREKSNWQGRGSSLLEGMSFNSAGLIQSLARTANANGITLYTLHAGGLSAYGAGATAENRSPVSYNVQQAALSNSTDSLQLLAQMTGGLATVGTNNFDGAFNQIENDLEHYYSIGYRAGTERVDRQRGVAVRMKNRNYVVRARQTFVEKSVPSEMNDRVIANIFYEGQPNDLNITVTTGQPVSVEEDRFKVPVEVHIPMDNLTFLPQGEMNVASFTVYFVAANQLGDMSDVTHQSHQIRLSKSELEKAKGDYYTFSAELLLEKGPNKISVGVVDDGSYVTGFRRQNILAADLR
ncbi:MAG: VWA domain-containing protein [Thermoanaerobaculia bacterium]